MIQILLCDDSQKHREKLSNLIYNYMEENKISFELETFNDYNFKFEEYIKKDNGKRVYFLDIEAPSQSGIDVARKIRTTDLNSIIVFVTGHEELAYEVLKNDLYILSFINKFNDLEQKMHDALEKIVKITNSKPSLKFVEYHTSYSITFDDILYISRDPIDRKCIIATSYSEFKVYKTMIELNSMLPKYFIQTHRSCIVNTKRISKYDKRNRLIEFNDGSTTDLVSLKYCKDLSNYVIKLPEVTTK